MRNNSWSHSPSIITPELSEEKSSTQSSIYSTNDFSFDIIFPKQTESDSESEVSRVPATIYSDDSSKFTDRLSSALITPPSKSYSESDVSRVPATIYSESADSSFMCKYNSDSESHVSLNMTGSLPFKIRYSQLTQPTQIIDTFIKRPQNKRAPDREKGDETFLVSKKIKLSSTTSAPVQPSPVKIRETQTNLQLRVPTDPRLGKAPKLVTVADITKTVKHGVPLANEIIVSKFLRSWFLSKENTKDLAPQNGLVITVDEKKIYLRSETIEGFNTLRSLADRSSQLGKILKEKHMLREQLLSHYAVFFMLLRNSDLHAGNLGYKMVGNKLCIAAVDFEQAFLIEQPKNSIYAIFEFIHLLRFWYGINELSPADLEVIRESLEHTCNNMDSIKALFNSAIEVSSRDCGEIINEKFPSYKAIFKYEPNNDKQTNPLVLVRFIKFNLFDEYCNWLTSELSTSALQIPGFLAELKPFIAHGIADIKGLLKECTINVDHFKELEKHRRSNSEEKSATL